MQVFLDLGFTGEPLLVFGLFRTDRLKARAMGLGERA